MATILVIDDEDAIRELLSMVLRSTGHNVVEASNGRQGVALYRQQPTDLAIVDRKLPGCGKPAAGFTYLYNPRLLISFDFWGIRQTSNP